jgi:hypothetical protein
MTARISAVTPAPLISGDGCAIPLGSTWHSRRTTSETGCTLSTLSEAHPYATFGDRQDARRPAPITNTPDQPVQGQLAAH